MPPPPPSRPTSLAQVVTALAALVVAAACVVMALYVVKLQETLRAPPTKSTALEDGLRAQTEALSKLEQRLRVESELNRTTATLANFQSLVENKRFELEHGLSCLAFVELLSRKPGFDSFAAEPDRKFAHNIYSRAVYEIENVNYATKDADHPITRELKNCVAPATGQERIGFPDELSVIVFRDRFDAQIDALFTPRFNLVLNTLSAPLSEYSDLAAPAKRLIDAQAGDWICNSAVRRLLLRKSDSALIKKIAEGRAKSLDDYVAANCPA